MKSISAAFGQASLALSKISSALTATVVAGVMLVALSLPASALTITSVGSLTTGNPCMTNPGDPICELFAVSDLQVSDSFTVNWNFMSGADVIDVDATFTLTAVVGDTLTLTVQMTNDSTSSEKNSITLLAITTGTETLSSASSSGTIFDLTDINGFFINVAYDACVFPDSCTGGNVNNGLPGGGNSETFILTLVAADFTWSLPTTLDHFLIKYQGVNSFEIAGTPSNGPPGGEVPEPASLLLFGIGLLGLGVFARRRRRMA